MLRVVLDSNAVDYIADEPGAFEAIGAAAEQKRLEVLWTHITIDELAAIPDGERRARLLAIAAGVARLVPTGAFVVDYSRLNFARLDDDEEAFEAMRKGNLRHTRDALIAVTAQVEAATLVTDDSRLAGRATAKGVPVMSCREFVAQFTS